VYLDHRHHFRQLQPEFVPHELQLLLLRMSNRQLLALLHPARPDQYQFGQGQLQERCLNRHLQKVREKQAHDRQSRVSRKSKKAEMQKGRPVIGSPFFLQV
jgi:hypothetical protein